MSETFIYSYVANHRRYEPVVVTEYLENTHQFPVAKAIVHRRKKYRYERELETFRNYLFKFSHREIVMSGFYRSALTGQIDVAHVHFGPPAVRLRHLLEKVPSVVSFYGYDLSQVPRALGQDFYIRTGLFDAVSIATVEGTHARNCLIAIGCPPDKARIVHIGVDLSRIDFRKRSGGASPRILFCGRFVRKKGLDVAIRALATLSRSRSFEFVIIGDGPLRAEIQQLALELLPSDRVSFVGLVDHQVFKEWCGRCDIFLAPSRTDPITGDTEGGSPTVLLEAAASGMVVVSSKHADIPEVVVDGVSARLSEEGDVDSLATALAEVLDNPSEWARMSEAGRDHVLKHYEVQTQTAILEDLYDEARSLH